VRRLTLLGSVAVLAAACGSSESSDAGAGGPGSGPAGADAGAHDRLMAVACDGCAPSPPMGSCQAVVEQQGIEGASHVAVCTVIDYGTNPPSSGDHYPVWGAYKTYTSAIPEGFWVHDLEHGGVVITYNCAGPQLGASECAGEVAAAQQMIDALPPDPACVQLAEGVSRRMVMTPDPKLDVPFAASAWGWTLRAHCFDPTVFREFALAHYDMGPESFCNDGEDPIAAGLPSGCGAN
jgi:hypothetical protein